MIRNKAADQAASMRFDTRELPFLTLWKNTAARGRLCYGDRAGHELSQQPADRAKLGRVPSLSPGASYSMTLDFAIHVGTAEVGQVAQEIARIQGDRRPLINEKPEKKE